MHSVLITLRHGPTGARPSSPRMRPALKTVPSTDRLGLPETTKYLSVSNNQRVTNLTRGFTMKHKQALRAIEECACEWVEVGKSIRDLTLAESIAKRHEMTRLRSPLEAAELPDLIVKGIPQHPELVRAARQFAAEATI